MQQKKQDALQQRPKKIESPLAKYSASGQLTCVACRAPVKSELAWTAHLAGRSHRDQVAALKSRQGTDKRPADTAAGAGAKHKRHKGGSALPGDFFEKPQAPKKGILKNAPARPTYAPPPSAASRLARPEATQQQERMDTDEPAGANHQSRGAMPPPAGVPSGSSGGGSSSGAAEPDTDTGQLPEGFFDDPQKDAKARHVEYVNPVEVEWDKFQREMQTQMAESEVILDEDQQEATVGRQIEEVDEQIRNLSRVVSMEKRKEQLAQQEAAAAAAAQAGGSDSSADEAEVEEFLDWRSKGTWK